MEHNTLSSPQDIAACRANQVGYDGCTVCVHVDNSTQGHCPFNSPYLQPSFSLICINISVSLQLVHTFTFRMRFEYQSIQCTHPILNSSLFLVDTDKCGIIKVHHQKFLRMSVARLFEANTHHELFPTDHIASVCRDYKGTEYHEG